MCRHVRGSFFSDYVRMIRRRKDVDWSRLLSPADLEYTRLQVELNGWYPMDAFERLGNAILSGGSASLAAVRMFGHLSVNNVVAVHPALIAKGDPMESLMRLKVLRASLFDFPAFDIPMLMNGHAHVVVNYQMGPAAEEAACCQTLGFCEGVVSLAGGKQVEAAFRERSWAGQDRTLIDLQWIED
jgi:hypothetical protein